jgi:pSer/pThr/pTyr-binding forkhead associated (FHA) protein
MGLFDIFGKGFGESRLVRAARSKELAGELGAAVDLYLEAELFDEAARVLLLRADGERSADKRIAFCASAARTAKGEALKKQALARKALLTFDVLRGQGGAFLRSDMASVAKELEDAGELERAAEAFALAGDAEAEVRTLTAAGAIERLEERLSQGESAERDERDRDITLRKIADLEKTAERRAALEIARAWLAAHDDERVADAARAIRARLARGPVVPLEIGGAKLLVALGVEVTIGRGDATILVASRAISRKHLRVRRVGAGLVIEDLGTRNGTMLAGARVTAPLPVGRGVRVDLGGEIPCSIEPRAEGGVVIEVGGSVYAAPLSDFDVGPWRVSFDGDGDESFVVLKTPTGKARPYLGDFELAQAVELAAGDEIRSERHGSIVLRVCRPRIEDGVSP